LVNRIGTNLIPIDIANANMISKKMKENIQALAMLKNEYYENKHKDENFIKAKEKEIYNEILKNKIIWLKQKITIFENRKNYGNKNGLFEESKVEKIYKVINKKIDKKISEYKSQIETLTKQLQDIIIH
jgi:hypothetical protein